MPTAPETETEIEKNRDMCIYMYIVITSRSRGPQSPQSPQWPQGPQRLATTCTHHVFGQRNQPTTFCIQISNQISGGPPNRVQHRFWVPACPCLQGPTPPSLTKLPHLEPTTHLHIKPTPKHPNTQRQRFSKRARMALKRWIHTACTQ